MIRVQKNTIFLYLVGLFIVNLIQAACLELSYDEAYYWVYSKFLSWGYYDHPPMVAWLIKMGDFIHHSEVGVRLFFNLLNVASFHLLWLMVDKKNLKHFIYLTLSYPLLQASGFLALPDTGLLFFATLFLYFVKDYLENDNLKNLLGLTISISLLFYSKYHGLAVVLLTTFSNPEFLKRKSFWLVVLGTVFLYLPHMYWQYSHDFLTFKFHLFGRGEKIFDYKNILNYLGSQVLLFGITNFILLLFTAKNINLKNPWERILFFNTFGFLILLFLVSFRNQIEANWTITACMTSIPLLMLLMDRHTFVHRYLLKSSVLSVILILSLRLILLLPTSVFAGKEIGRLNEVKGWQARIDKIRLMTEDKKIVSDTYQMASKLSFYLNRFIPALHLSSRDSHFSLLKHELAQIGPNEEIIFLSPKIQTNTIKIETGYKDPIYLFRTTLRKLTKRYGMTYEEAIRNRHK